MQLTHSPSTRIPSTRASFPSPRHPTPDPPMYPPTPCHPDSYKQAASSHPNPFPPRVTSSSAPRCSADLYDSTKLSILSGATFTTPTAPIFFLSSPTDTLRVDPFDVIILFTLGVHIFPTLRMAFPLRETTTGPTSWFFTERRGKGGRIYCFIFLNGFRRIDLRRLTRPVLVTRRCDAPTRSLSPRFFPG